MSFDTRHVCITGGEPLIQKAVHALMTRLCDHGYIVSLETSGAFDCSQVDPRVKRVIDVKTPDSGEADSFCFTNIASADVNTEFKFVICSDLDFDWAEKFVKQHQLYERSQVLYSPSFQAVDEKWLAKKILSRRSTARLQLQLHKYIWSPHSRGV